MKKLFTIAMIAFCIKFSIAQKFNKQQPDILYAVDKNGDTLNVKTGFGTANPTERIDVKGTVKTDTLKVSRVMAADGDSAIHFGENSISLLLSGNRIKWSPTKSGCSPFAGYGGLTIANGSSIAGGTNSMAFGNNVNVPCNAPNAFAVGNGVTNNIGNSFMLGWNGTTLFADATGVGINLTSHTQTLDVNGTENIRTVTQNDALTQVLVRDPNNLGLIQWRDASTLAGAANAWLITGNFNATFPNNKFGTFTSDDIQIYTNSSFRGIIHKTGNWGVGNIGVPNHLLDVRNGDINTGNGTPASPQGYMIGDNYVLRHVADISRIYVGVGAGNSTSAGFANTFVGGNAGNSNIGSAAGLGSFNTFLGNSAGRSNTDGIANTFTGDSSGFSNTTGNFNTFNGYLSGYSNTTGKKNTFLGDSAGYSNTTGLLNTFVGTAAGFSNSVSICNTFIGFEAGLNNNGSIANFNTFTGFWAGRDNITGGGNSYYGKDAGMSTTDGFYNVYMGFHCAKFASHGSFNVVIGSLANSVPTNTTGQSNVIIGYNAGANNGGDNNAFFGNYAGSNNCGTSTSGLKNTYIGSESMSSTINGNVCTVYDSSSTLGANTLVGGSNSTAIGANAVTVGANSMILGSNNVNVGIGLSDVTPGPGNKLEINAITGTGTSIDDVPGASGLRFRDLTSSSTKITNPGTGVLSVDASGDVIYVPASIGGGAFGVQCPSANPAVDGLQFNTEIPLNDKNLVFSNTLTPTPGKNLVGIGISGCNPIAKLDILNTTEDFAINAKSTKAGTVINALNNANGAGSDIWAIQGNVPNGGTGDIIGVEGSATASGTGRSWGFQGSASGGAISRGGEFSASGAAKNQGIYAYVNTLVANPSGDYAGVFAGNVFVNGNGTYLSTWQPSDRLIKTDTIPFYSGLSVIRNINPISYKYNGKAGFDTKNTYYGVIAQQLAQAAPYAVDTFFAKLDTADTNATPLLAVKNEAIMYTTVNAVKQLDSIVTKATSVPDAPVLISPADGAVDNFSKTQLTWHSVSVGIVIYHAQVAQDNAFSNLVFDRSDITDTTTFLGLCDSIPTAYYWRVSAKNNTGTGAWSAVFSFTDTTKCLKLESPPPIRAAEAVSFNSTSDSQFKTNIAPLTGALNKVSQLNGVYYDWLHNNPLYQFDSAQQIGFIAQDVQPIIPQVVHTDSNGFLTIDYGRVVPVLVEAIKQQQQTINSQQTAIDSLKLIVSGQASSAVDSVQSAQIAAMQECISNLPSGMGCTPSSKKANPDSGNDDNGRTAQQIIIASPAAVILYQNEPNPFSNSTIIRYFVPESAKEAYISFSDEFGREISKEKLTQLGYAKVDVNAEKLASGIYTYSIVVDGKIADTKRMLKAK